MATMDQKLRTLYLMDIMLERTDEEHLLNASQPCSILENEYGISADRRTIYSEMDILKKYGLDIIQKKGKNPACRAFLMGEVPHPHRDTRRLPHMRCSMPLSGRVWTKRLSRLSTNRSRSR